MKKNVCYVITNPMIAANRSAEVSLRKFLRVISAVYDEIHVVGGNLAAVADAAVHLHTWDILRAKSKIKRIWDIAYLQMKMSRYILRAVSRDVPVYFWIGDKMLLPFLAARYRRADIRYFLYGNVLREGRTGTAAKLSGKLIAWMANHADSVCVESPGVMGEWEGMIHHDRVRTICLYTETAALPADTEPNPVIGMLCRLTEGKHILESIEAFAEFHAVCPQYRMEIVGSGKQEALCREKIAALGVGSCIHLLGWVDHAHIPETIGKWKYLLFPTDTEGMPNSVLEAMGCGIPALASPVGGLRDLIRPGENGWFLQNTTKDGILSGLHHAVQQDMDYRKISSAAAETVCGQFSLEAAQEQAKKSCGNL